MECGNCNFDLTDQDIQSEEDAATLCKDLVNGETYPEEEQVPGGHGYDLHAVKKRCYVCPECGGETEEEETVFVRTVSRE